LRRSLAYVKMLTMDLGQRIEFHSHTVFSDGLLLPAALVREAEMLGHLALGIADHVDQSNVEEVVKALVRFERETRGKLALKFLPGAEVSYVIPPEIAKYCRQAKKYGAKFVIVHGQSPVEPVYPGTNHAAVSAKGLVDILAHPGMISEEDVRLAAANGVYLELSAKKGHRDGNRHVAALAKKCGAKLLVNTDAHTERDLIDQEQAWKIAQEAGLNEAEALVAVRDNALELLKRIERR